MNKFARISSPAGEIFMSADSAGLTGLWFEEQRRGMKIHEESLREENCAFFDAAKEWLEIYFSGRDPGFMVPLSLSGTQFQMLVWQAISEVKFGCTASYGSLAKSLAKMKGLDRMSARAVGHAVGCNPISIIIPCHRIIGSDGSLTGYAGGIEKKIALLSVEGIKTDGRKVLMQRS